MLTKCLTCGCFFPDTHKTNRKMYCSDDCRNYHKYKNALDSILTRISPCDDSSRVIRADMFQLANKMQFGTK
jgi:hypothetical protein